MSKNNHYFPIKEGEYKIVESINPSDFGIYRCIISPGKKDKLFNFNRLNYYTSVDVYHALEYGLTVELIQDGQPNFLYYSKDKLINGAFAFKNYMHELFELKRQKIEGAKLLLNILWGALSETNTYKFITDCDEELNLVDCELTDLAFTGYAVQTKIINYNQSYYKYKFARIKPFVLSYGRFSLYKQFKKYEDKIIRVHTDGVYMTQEVDIETSTDLGGIKYEGVKEVDITALNRLGAK
jgi:hypothetical protein